jgi:hypothetical protein
MLYKNLCNSGGRWIRTLAENPTQGILRLSGPRHQHNSTPTRGKIVPKKGQGASQRLIPSLARDTAPFICGGNWVSLPKAARLSEIVNTDTRDQRVTGRGSRYTVIVQHPITRHGGLLWNRNRAIHTQSEFYRS